MNRRLLSLELVDTNGRVPDAGRVTGHQPREFRRSRGFDSAMASLPPDRQWPATASPPMWRWARLCLSALAIWRVLSRSRGTCGCGRKVDDWLALAILYEREQRFEDAKKARERAAAVNRK